MKHLLSALILLLAFSLGHPARGGESLLGSGVDLSWDEEEAPVHEAAAESASGDKDDKEDEEAASDEPSSADELPSEDRVSVARLAETAELMVNRHEYEDALATIARAMEIDPTYIPLWLQSARAHMALGRNDEAAAALAMCLKRNPHDTDANHLVMLNILQWEGLSDLEKASRIGEAVRAMDKGVFDRAAARLIEMDELPSRLRTLTDGWRRGGPHAAAAVPALQLYAANRIEEARRVVDDQAGLSPALARAFRGLLEKTAANGGLASWVVERGGLRWEGGELVLDAPAATQAFAWLRLSRDWRDVVLTLSVSESKQGGESREIYLRYESPASYLRILFDRERLQIQERLPEAGLVGIFDQPLAAFAGGELTVLLKGDRLGLFSDGEAVLADYLAVSPPVAKGAVVLACDNRSGDAPLRAGFGIGVQSLPERWKILDAGMNMEAGELGRYLRENNLTGMLIPIDNGPDNGPDNDADNDVGEGMTARILMTLANHGVKAFALPPEGDAKLASLSASLTGLPEVLADRLWSGVALRVSGEKIPEPVREALAAANASGLPVALLVAPEGAEGGWREVSGKADWVLCDEAGNWSGAALAGLMDFGGTVLYGRGEAERVFSGVLVSGPDHTDHEER